MFSWRFCAVTMISVKVGWVVVSARTFPAKAIEITTIPVRPPGQATARLAGFRTATLVMPAILFLLRRVHARLRHGGPESPLQPLAPYTPDRSLGAHLPPANARSELTENGLSRSTPGANVLTLDAKKG
jgi:hypothetical protein